MPGTLSSWRRDTARLYVKYMLVGAAAIPAGIAYAYVAKAGLESPITVVSILLLGLVLATLAIRYAEHRWFSFGRSARRSGPELTVYVTAAEETMAAPAVVTAVVIVLIAFNVQSLDRNAHIRFIESSTVNLRPQVKAPLIAQHV